jgi:ribonuclease VapC
MIVDTSAIFAILREEADALSMAAALADADVLRISAGTWIELEAVRVRSGNGRGRAGFDAFLAAFPFVIEPVTTEQAALGRLAYRTYGRGTGHRAKLNLGDCFSYALAKSRNEPLLFKGDDFSQTDIIPAL